MTSVPFHSALCLRGLYVDVGSPGSMVAANDVPSRRRQGDLCLISAGRYVLWGRTEPDHSPVIIGGSCNSYSVEPTRIQIPLDVPLNQHLLLHFLVGKLYPPGWEEVHLVMYAASEGDGKVLVQYPASQSRMAKYHEICLAIPGKSREEALAFVCGLLLDEKQIETWKVKV